MLRIWSWNVNGQDVRSGLDAAADTGDLDVALLQECRRPDGPGRSSPTETASGARPAGPMGRDIDMIAPGNGRGR